MNPAAHYVGIPYQDRGRDPAVALDCWGLVRYWYACELGILLPAHDDAPSFGRDRQALPAYLLAHARAWQPTTGPLQRGDVLLLRQGTRPFHIGLYAGLQEGRRMLLHTCLATDSVYEPMDVPEWANRILGAYRHG